MTGSRLPQRADRGWHGWLKPGELVFVVGCLLVLAGLGVDVAAGGLFTQLDDSVAESVGPGGGVGDWMLLVSEIGSLGVSGAIVAITTLVSAQRTWRWWPVALSAGVLTTAGALVVTTKTLVGRDGPPGVETAAGYPGYFPSGHAATSVVCLGTAALLLVALRHPGLGVARVPDSAARWDRALLVSWVVGAVAGVAVGTGSVLTGYHWLSDICGGIALGMAVLVAGTALARGYVCRRTGVRPPPGH